MINDYTELFQVLCDLEVAKGIVLELDRLGFGGGSVFGGTLDALLVAFCYAGYCSMEWLSHC